MYFLYNCIFCYPYYCYKHPPVYIFTFSVIKNEKILHRLPIPSSGFHSVQNSIIKKVDTTKEKHDIICQNVAHLGSFNKVNVNKALQCQPCTEYGAQMKLTYDVW